MLLTYAITVQSSDFISEGNSVVIKTPHESGTFIEGHSIFVGLVDAVQTLACQHGVVSLQMTQERQIALAAHLIAYAVGTDVHHVLSLIFHHITVVAIRQRQFAIGRQCLHRHQKTVDVFFDYRILTLMQLAVLMSANNAPRHAVGNAETLPHLMSCLCRNLHGIISQPFIVGISQEQEGARTNHRTQLMLVVRQSIYIVTTEIGAHTLQEPMIVGAFQTLHILLSMRCPPRRSTTATRFLCYGQCYTFVKSTAIEGHLSGIRATGNTYAPGINLRLLFAQQLQTVNQPAQSPCPVTVCPVVFQLRIQPVDIMLAPLLVLAPLGVVVHLCLMEYHDGYRTVLKDFLRQRNATCSYHQGIGSIACLWVSYR